jgi:hypothetical protein
VLRPLGADGAEVMAQTRRLIAEVLPKVAARWPKPSKQAGKQSGKPADVPALLAPARARAIGPTWAGNGGRRATGAVRCASRATFP